MEIKTGNMSANEVRKTALLITRAGELGMDLSGYGFADVNKTRGNVYLWLEDYNFCLFIGLGGDRIDACYSCSYDGEQTIRQAGRSLASLERWSDKLSIRSYRKEQAA